MDWSQSRVEDVMSIALATVKPSASIGRAMQTMRYADARHLPVVDDQGHCVGILSDRDLLKAKIGKPCKPLCVEDVMTRRPQVATPEMSVSEVASLFVDEKISALPVVDKGRLVGIVTSTDVMRLKSTG